MKKLHAILIAITATYLRKYRGFVVEGVSGEQMAEMGA